MKNYLVLFLLFISIRVLSQEGTSNNGNLQIYRNGSMAVFGDFTNASTGSFQNDGSLYIKKSFTNGQALMSTGTGTLFLNGNMVQSISGSEPVNTFNLVTNNSSGFTLNNNLLIGGAHTFSAGIITTSSSPNYLIYEAGSSYSGAIDAAHVNGWVKKWGATDFTFPTGDGAHLREMTIMNLSENSEFDVRYNGAILTSARSTQLPLVVVNPSEYWAINKLSGGTAQLRLNWDNNKVYFPNFVISDLRVGWFSGTDWTNSDGSASGVTTEAGYIISPPLSTFGSFAIASTSWALPLNFLGIAAMRDNASVKINWQTANEIAVDRYEVQRSLTGSDFSTIGTAAAKNLDRQTYTHPDPGAPASKLFYRIKAVDINGSVRYSRIASVAAAGQTSRIELVENPVRNSIQLATYGVAAVEYSYQLIDGAGQLCKKGSFKCSGTSVVSIPVKAIPGNYTLIINNSKHQQQFKIIVL